jgi:hypothetical protein
MKISFREHVVGGYDGRGGKKNTYTIFEDLSSREINAFLKCNIHANMRLRNPLTDKMTCLIELRERTVGSDDKQVIMTNLNAEIKKPKGFTTNAVKFVPRSYDEILDQIMPDLVLTIEINNVTYEKKKPLISILGSIKTGLIDSCVYLDYRDDCFVIVNKPSHKGSDKMFYWEENRNLLYFSDDDVQLIRDSKYQNAEQLLCGD